MIHFKYKELLLCILTCVLSYAQQSEAMKTLPQLIESLSALLQMQPEEQRSSPKQILEGSRECEDELQNLQAMTMYMPEGNRKLKVRESIQVEMKRLQIIKKNAETKLSLSALLQTLSPRQELSQTQTESIKQLLLNITHSIMYTELPMQNQEKIHTIMRDIKTKLSDKHQET